jgi:hypothetical protein
MCVLVGEGGERSSAPISGARAPISSSAIAGMRCSRIKTEKMKASAHSSSAALMAPKRSCGDAASSSSSGSAAAFADAISLSAPATSPRCSA